LESYLFDLHPFLCVGGILLTGIHLPDNKKISFINAYGPCSGHRLFWERVEAKGLLSMDALILVGDLNFTTSFDEVWGVGALMDPLAGFFKDMFAKNLLVDIQPDGAGANLAQWQKQESGDTKTFGQSLCFSISSG
jgi:hypothetical protein